MNHRMAEEAERLEEEVDVLAAEIDALVSRQQRALALRLAAVFAVVLIFACSSSLSQAPEADR